MCRGRAERRGAVSMGIGERAVTVRTYKYDGTPHRRWRAQISRQEGSLLVLDAKFEEEIRHPLLGTVARETSSIEYYWLDRWYNIFRFLEPSGQLRNYYCNVNVPPVFDGRVLSFIDLDMDILVAPDLSFRILDREEFEINAVRYQYPPEVRFQAHHALLDLAALIEAREFPFDEHP